MATATLDKPATDRVTKINAAIDRAEEARQEYLNAPGENPPPASLLVLASRAVEEFARGAIPEELVGLTKDVEELAKHLLGTYQNEAFQPGEHAWPMGLSLSWEQLLRRRDFLRDEPSPVESVAELVTQNVPTKQIAKMLGWSHEQILEEIRTPGTLKGEAPVMAVKRRERVGAISDGVALSCLIPALKAQRIMRSSEV
jgi:hypothetical protein